MHDIQHTGMTNSFLVSTRHDLAIKYNDISIAENYSLATFFDLLESDIEANIFDGLSSTDWIDFRRRVIKIVHSTDLEKHVSVIDKFKARLTAGDFDPQTNNDHMNILLKMIMKCADLSFFARRADIAHMWASRLSNEFYVEGDIERDAGVRVTKYMDRKVDDVSELLLLMANAVVLPMWKLWAQYTNDNRQVEIVERNIEIWKKEVKRSQRHRRQRQVQVQVHQQSPSQKQVVKVKERKHEHKREREKEDVVKEVVVDDDDDEVGEVVVNTIDKVDNSNVKDNNNVNNVKDNNNNNIKDDDDNIVNNDNMNKEVGDNEDENVCDDNDNNNNKEDVNQQQHNNNNNDSQHKHKHKKKKKNRKVQEDVELESSTNVKDDVIVNEDDNNDKD